MIANTRAEVVAVMTFQEKSGGTDAEVAECFIRRFRPKQKNGFITMYLVVTFKCGKIHYKEHTHVDNYQPEMGKSFSVIRCSAKKVTLPRKATKVRSA